jgi:hypothetical protein
VCGRQLFGLEDAAGWRGRRPSSLEILSWFLALWTPALLLAGCGEPPHFGGWPPKPKSVPTGDRPAVGVNLLRNGSFEEYSKKEFDEVWYWINQPIPGQAVDKDVKIDGKQSLRFDQPGFQGAIGLMQYVILKDGKLTPGARYRLSGYMKTEDVAQECSLVVYTGHETKNEFFTNTKALSGTTEWSELQVEFGLALTGTFIGVRINCPKVTGPQQPTGRLWVDGLNLMELP